MSHRVISASVQGIEACQIIVQIDSSPGIHSLSIVGLADKAVQESQDRINSAVKNSGLVHPRAKNRRFTVNLAPADLKKEGSAFDLPIAVAFLLESRQLASDLTKRLLIGELSLDGSVSSVSGVLAATILARELGCKEIVVPAANAAEAAFAGEIDAIGVSSLAQAVGHLDGSAPIEPAAADDFREPVEPDDSFAHISGQNAAKRALVIAAAGSHNILMKGPPGSGKTILARSITGLLPPLSRDEAAEVAKIYSSVGHLNGSPSDIRRPFRSPHHTSSPVAIVGGGSRPRPGEISLAHRGILFLDEFPEFARNVLEALRQPLEDGVITISRAAGTMKLPADFLLIAAMNPCPCGNFGDPNTTCTCVPTQVNRYAKKVSGPLLDRIDIQINVPRETIESPKQGVDTDGFRLTRTAISDARRLQAERLKPLNTLTNSSVGHKDIERFCPMDEAAGRLMESAVNRHGLSLRSYHRMRRVARTIADLEGSEFIRQHHAAEAVALRLTARI